MESIELTDLAGYREDSEARRRFERPYLPASLSGLALALMGFFLVISEMNASHYIKGRPVGFLDGVWFSFVKLVSQFPISTTVLNCLPAMFFAGGLIALLLVSWRMGTAVPTNSAGLKMERYWNANAPSGYREMIYVDRANQTYFRRVISQVTSRGIIRS